MKKLLITFSFVLLVVMGIYANQFFSFAASTTEFCLRSNSNEDVEIGDKVKMQVCLNSDEIDGFQGTIMYDKDLVLTEITPSNDFSSKVPIYDYGPSVDLSGEAICKTDSSKKMIGFDGTLNENDIKDGKTFSGDMTILNLTFDTSNCEEGKTYNVSWDTSKSKLVGAKTCAFKAQSKQPITTKPLAIIMVGANTEDSNDDPIISGDEDPGKDDEDQITGGNEEPGKDDEDQITGGDEDPGKDDEDQITDGDKEKEDNNSTPSGDKETNEQKEQTIDKENNDQNNIESSNKDTTDKKQDNTTANTTTVKDENIDKMPQTGSNLLTYTIILLVIVEVSVFVSYKKMKKYSGI